MQGLESGHFGMMMGGLMLDVQRRGLCDKFEDEQRVRYIEKLLC